MFIHLHACAQLAKQLKLVISELEIIYLINVLSVLAGVFSSTYHLSVFPFGIYLCFQTQAQQRNLFTLLPIYFRVFLRRSDIYQI